MSANEPQIGKHVVRAMGFLKRLPVETCVLTAMDPMRGYIRTRAFAPGHDDAMAAFIREWHGRRNLYYLPQIDMRSASAIRKKSRKTDIKTVAALSADLDFYKEESREAGLQRAISVLRTPPDGVPGPPSVAVMSGNGVNPLWLLRDPVQIGGDVNKAAEVERYGRGLAAALGGDHTFNVDRILRLPWTVNLPDKRKAERGLKPVATRVLWFKRDRLYDLQDFTPAESDGRDHMQEAAFVADYLPRIGPPVTPDSLAHLIVNERTEMIIALGCIPGINKEGGRSSWLFAAILAMIRQGVPNDTILGAVLNPEWAISESVLEKPDPETYARRQIARAHSFICLNAKKAFNDEI